MATTERASARGGESRASEPTASTRSPCSQPSGHWPSYRSPSDQSSFDQSSSGQFLPPALSPSQAPEAQPARPLFQILHLLAKLLDHRLELKPDIGERHVV